MNPFRKLGRQVEQLKAKATAAAAEETTYRCTECEARFGEPHDRCPECESGAVVAVERET